jgi:exopolysaccharide production protein ExoZ
MKPLLSIQYLRALAAIAVVAFHSGRATILGQAGVDVFFVISGFIMWMVTERPVGPASFLWHRILRIVPLYWIATLLMAAHRQSSVADTAMSLLFWPHRDPDGQIWPVLVQGWTLNFEMFFYLLFAASLLLPRRWQIGALTLVLCGLGAAGIALRPSGAAAATYTSPLLLEFLAGIWLSEITRRGYLPRSRIAWAMIAVAAVAFLLSLRGPTPEICRFAVWGIPSLLAVAGVLALEVDRGMPSIGGLKLLGDGSYSIYLFHPFLLRTVEKPLVRFPAPVPVAAVVIVGTAVGLAVYVCVERPLTAWLRRHTRRGGKPSPVPRVQPGPTPAA